MACWYIYPMWFTTNYFHNLFFYIRTALDYIICMYAHVWVWCVLTFHHLIYHFSNIFVWRFCAPYKKSSNFKCSHIFLGFVPSLYAFLTRVEGFWIYPNSPPQFLSEIKLVWIYFPSLIGIMVKVCTNSPGDRGSISGQVIPKTLKLVLVLSLLNTQHYHIYQPLRLGRIWHKVNF